MRRTAKSVAFCFRRFWNLMRAKQRVAPTLIRASSGCWARSTAILRRRTKATASPGCVAGPRKWGCATLKPWGLQWQTILMLPRFLRAHHQCRGPLFHSRSRSFCRYWSLRASGYEKGLLCVAGKRSRLSGPFFTLRFSCPRTRDRSSMLCRAPVWVMVRICVIQLCFLP